MASTNQDPARPGNEFFVRNEYENALEAYSTAINQHPEMAKLYSYRALTYLKLGRPFPALEDLDIGLTLDPDDDKMIYRKCTALLALRRFSDAGQFLDESIGRLEHLAKSKEFKTMINDMNRLKLEYERGQFDLLIMLEESKKSKYLDNHADFYAWNKFEIRDIDGKGRGLVAKDTIEAGELLIACKAFVFIHSISEGYYEVITEEKRTVVHYIGPLIEKARKKIMARPDLAEEFYRLHAGPSSIDDAMDRIESIVRLNNFESFAVDKVGAKDPGLIDGGLWLIPSYINHTCVDTNCSRYFVGDYMFVRATKSIEKDEEILFDYVDAFEPFEVRQRRCRDTYGFDCQCRLCVMDRRDPIENKQRMEEIRKAANDTAERATVENLLQESLQVRPQRDLNYLASHVQGRLFSLTVNKNECRRLLIERLEIEKSNGGNVATLIVLRALYRASRFKGMKEQEKWKKEAGGIAKLIYGDERVADLVFAED